MLVKEKENFILIECDQLRPDFLSCYGFSMKTSPDIDRLAMEGVCFEGAYTPIPLTIPADVSLFTGRFAKAHGIRTNQPMEGARFTKDLTQVLREAGYQIALIGKAMTGLLRLGSPGCVLKPEDYYIAYMHEYGPPRKGCEKVDGEFNTWMGRLNHWISMEPTPFPLDCQYPTRIAEDCITYLKEHSKEPFFLRFFTPEPHNPYQVPIPYWDMFPPDKVPDRVAGPEYLREKGFPWDWELKLIQHYHPEYDPEKDDTIWRRYRSNYCGMIRLINDAIGKFLDFLDSSGLSERTHVFFLSDHGDYVGDFGLLRKGVGVPECLSRVPFIWRGPGISKGKVVKDAFVSLVDIMPTICEIVGVEPPLGVQGRSIVSILQDKPYPKEEFSSIYVEQGTGGRRVHTEFNHRSCMIRNRAGGRDTFQELNIVTQGGSIKMLRKGDWKLIFDWEKFPELYNVVEDPVERRNLFGDPRYQELGLEMLQDLFRWTVRTEEQFPWPVTDFSRWEEYLRYRMKLRESINP